MSYGPYGEDYYEPEEDREGKCHVCGKWTADEGSYFCDVCQLFTCPKCLVKVELMPGLVEYYCKTCLDESKKEVDVSGST